MAETAFAPADLAAGLATALQRAGVAVPADRAGSLAAALRLVHPADRDRLYWTARVTLVSRHADLPVFDAVFSALFDGLLDPADSRGDPTAPPPVGSEPRRRRPSGGRPVEGSAPPGTVPSAGATAGEDGEPQVVPVAASAAERLHGTSFAELDEAELAQVRALVRRLVLSTPPRRTRRSRPTARPGEQLDLRRTLRAAQRTAGEPVRLQHRLRREQPRRLVLLCDVSGSMQTWTRVYLTLLQGAVAGAHAEAFVFSTRLTRLTRSLSVRDPDQALARAAAAAPDWAGGTRLAGSLQRFLDVHGRRGTARGAVVVVLSDGWSTDDPEQVGVQMARLQRLAHRVVWVNPRQAAPGFAPKVGGMAAALPHVDALVSGHSLAALDELVVAVSREAGSSRSSRGRTA